MEEKHFGRETFKMKRIYVYCEGQTEESFVNNLLTDYFSQKEIQVTPIICTTKRTSVRKFKGGISSFEKFSKELKIICKQHPNEKVTTMIDYYGLPNDFPGINLPEPDIYKKVEQIEVSIKENIGVENLSVYISLHEFESLLYSEPNVFCSFGNSVDRQIKEIKENFNNNPEKINDSKETSPSKRILGCIADYSKISDGTKLAKEIGIEKMMQECKHFKEWIERLGGFVSS